MRTHPAAIRVRCVCVPCHRQVDLAVDLWFRSHGVTCDCCGDPMTMLQSSPGIDVGPIWADVPPVVPEPALVM